MVEFLSINSLKVDLKKILWGNENNGEIEIGEKMISISKDTEIILINKGYFETTFDISFGNHFFYQVSIGKIIKNQNGVLYSEHCFCTMYYNTEKLLITADFYKYMR